MLIIRPIQEKEYHRSLALECGAEPTPDSFAYLIADADEDTHEIRQKIGICEFTIKNDEGVMTRLTSLPGISDDEALMIAARTAMSLMFRCGLHSAYFADNSADEKLIRSLGFKPNGGRYGIDLDTFYASPCRYNGTAEEKPE